MAKNNDAIKIIEKINNGDSEIQEMIAVASINATVAQLKCNSKKSKVFNATTK